MLSVMLRADNPESIGESVMPADHSMNARTFSMFSSSADMASLSPGSMAGRPGPLYAGLRLKCDIRSSYFRMNGAASASTLALRNLGTDGQRARDAMY